MHNKESDIGKNRTRQRRYYRKNNAKYQEDQSQGKKKIDHSPKIKALLKLVLVGSHDFVGIASLGVDNYRGFGKINAFDIYHGALLVASE